MLSFSSPTAETVDRFLAEQARLDFSYSEVGATANAPPAGYTVDRTRVKLGEGAATFAAAQATLRRWGQFNLGWLEARPPETPIQVGAVVAVVAQAVGLWWLNACRIVYVNACRIVYVVDESGATQRFGFAYGTLPAHIERGEERFLVEFNRADNSVWYDILALSRPHHWTARLGYPMVRRYQRRFGRESAAAMLRYARMASP